MRTGTAVDFGAGDRKTISILHKRKAGGDK